MAEPAGPIAHGTMRGGGYYSAVTRCAKDAIDGAIPLVCEAVRRLPETDPSRPFTLDDIGCADGGTSLDLVHQAILSVRARWPRRPIVVVYTDQPRNDFNSLFQLVHGLTPTRSYFHAVEDVYVLATATSFYRPLVPPGTLDLGFSAAAMHWLSRKPGDLPAHIQAIGASDGYLAAFAEQARQDWETLLLRRARELAPGGRLVLVNFCRDEAGRYMGHTGGHNMFDVLNTLWQRFVAEGVVRPDEYARMTLPTYYRTVEECIEPLTDPGSAVYRGGLRLEHCETRVIPCPYAAAFERHGDAARFAREYIPSLQSWSESTFLAALAPERPIEERQRIIEHYYGAYETLVRESPDGHRKDNVHLYMTLANTGI